MTRIFSGSCLCGAVAYRVSSRPKAVSHCHCSQCRKGHGAAFASYGSVPRADLHITKGSESLKGYQSSASVVRQFCCHCGSSLFWSTSEGEFSGWVSIALGCLDTSFTPGHQKHLHVGTKAAWYEIQDHGPESD
ncbi:GFA family protein [Pseudomonas sp. FFUP_PS_473]|uniref:GFA family protein n=1 Tax=Pseudomonas sp. FFUP_PS_473 TaxID=2060418 RepID=UPI000C79A223|nr:GFA family protein [Pseudomonas sp. FFUP_PS_473]PLP85613.1 GFA family protein [Pseudomonas sp. FFUP_PS_473]